VTYRTAVKDGLATLSPQPGKTVNIAVCSTAGGLAHNISVAAKCCCDSVLRQCAANSEFSRRAGASLAYKSETSAKKILPVVERNGTAYERRSPDDWGVGIAESFFVDDGGDFSCQSSGAAVLVKDDYFVGLLHGLAIHGVERRKRAQVEDFQFRFPLY